MLTFFRHFRSKLDLVIRISPGLLAVAVFPAFSSNSTVMTFSTYATIILASIWILAGLCKVVSKGMIVLFLAAIPMPFLSSMAIYEALQFSLDFHQQAVSLAEMANIKQTLLHLMTIITSYAFFLATFCLPTSKKPPSRSKQDVLRRGAVIVLAVSAASVVLPIFVIVQQFGFGQ